MAKTPDDQRLELLQGTLDMLILRTLQWGPQHGHGIGQAIRVAIGRPPQSRNRVALSQRCTGWKSAHG